MILQLFTAYLWHFPEEDNAFFPSSTGDHRGILTDIWEPAFLVETLSTSMVCYIIAICRTLIQDRYLRAGISFNHHQIKMSVPLQNFRAPILLFSMDSTLSGSWQTRPTSFHWKILLMLYSTWVKVVNHLKIDNANYYIIYIIWHLANCFLLALMHTQWCHRCTARIAESGYSD